MKIKNSNLEWYVFYMDFNKSTPRFMNILGYDFAEDLAKRMKREKVKNKEQLKEILRREFMYHYWCKSEFEYGICSLWAKDIEKDVEKHDVWFQIEHNLDAITDYIIYKMKIDFKDDEEEV